MNKNEFILNLIGCLQQAKTKKQINADIRELEKKIDMLRITGTLAKGDTKKELNQHIKELSEKLSYIMLKGKLDEKSLKRDIDKSLHNMTFKEIDALNVDGNKAKLKMQKVVADLKAFAEKTPISVNVQLKKEKLGNDLTTFLNKNSKIRESSVLLAESERIRDIIDSVDDKETLKSATDAFNMFKSEVSATGYATKSTTDKIKSMLSRITKIGSLFGVASLAVNNFRKSLSTLRSNDTILTEISKTSEMTKQQLKGLGDEAFKVASKYGQLSSNYLLGVQEMARSGYEELSKELAELSLLAQSAGNMTAENANNYLLATDAAYKYYGSVEKLNAALDGANFISNRNSASLTDIAEATRVSASFAANAGVAIDELTAAEATMIATTKRSGSEIGRAFRSIVLNLQQVSGEFDGEIIDEEQLKKVEARCHSLGVELEYMKNGVPTLRNTMEVLKELAEVYNSLPDNSAEKQGLISDLGGKYHANALSALLSRWDLYEKMLGEFSQGAGSALEEAEKTANSWEGRLNSLQNSFDSFVNTLTNKDAIMGGISFFDRLIQGAEGLTNAIGEIPVVLTALNSALVATNKDYGLSQIWNKDKGKIDIQGNIFGIDFTAIKNMKKHFAEAEEAIAGWNVELKAGNADINDFGEAVVQNYAQFREYLSTCSKNAPASLEGYKSHLKAVGVNTDTLRLKTILLNSAITMLGGLALQTVITGFYKLLQVSSNVAENAKKLGSEFNDTKSDIESYKSQIKELYSTINDSNSSIKDVTNARKTLMSVQDELIEKFGTEESVIRNVTDAINGQTEALDILTRAKWQEVKNEFNNGDFWNDISNFFQGTDNIERMLSEYGKKNIVLPWVEYAGDMIEITDDMVAKLENIGIDIKVSADDLQGLRDFDSLTESIVGKRGISLYIEGNAEEVYNKILSLQNLANGDDSFGKFYKNIERHANSYKELTDKYKDFYDQYILYEKILAEDSDYTDTFKEITDAAEKYNEAFMSGNEEEIKRVSDEYASLLSTAMAAAIANGDSDIATYFENMYPTLKSIVDSWNFNVAFDVNTGDLQTKVQSVLDGLKNKDGRSLTAEEILGLGEANEQYQNLVSIAHSYNMSIEEMIDLLKERNLISAMDYQGLVGLFGQKNVDKLSTGDIEIAYTIKNVGNMTFDELQVAIEKTKEVAEEPMVSFSVSDTIDQLNTKLKPAFDSLKSAWQDIFTDDGFDKDAVDIPMLNSIKSSIEGIKELGINIDLSAFEEFATTLTDVNTTEKQAKQAFNEFATSIFYATGATEGITAETKELVEQLLESLGVVNASEVAEYSLAAAERELLEAKAQSIVAAYDLVNASNEGYVALLEEAGAAGVAKQQIYNLAASEIAYGTSNLSVEQKIQKLKKLARAYGDTTTAALAAAIANDLASGHTDVDTALNDLMKQINSTMQEVEIEFPEIDFSGLEKKASKAGSKAGDAYMDALKDKLSNFGNVIKYISDNIGDQIGLFEDQKNAAVEALEAQQKAAKEALEAEKSLVQEQIDAKQAEIDKIEEAAKARKNEIDLQQKQFELARLQNHKTILQYSEDKGMHYVTDTQGIRDAQEAVTEAKENIQIANLKKEISGLDDTIDNLDKKIEESNDYYAKLIEQAKNYWDALIKGLEDYKSRWTELANIEEQAKMEVALRNLGITADDILNMSESTFDSFKNNYLGVLHEMYAGNDEMISMLQELGGISPEAIQPLSDSLGNAGDVASDTKDRISEIADELDNLDGMTSECTVKVNIETVGSIPQYVSKIAQNGSIDPISDKSQNKGTAHYEGTAKVTGDWGVGESGRSLVGELGQELWVHSKDGTFETVGDKGPEFINTEKGDLIFNHLQTRELLDKGSLAGKPKILADGRAYVEGTGTDPLQYRRPDDPIMQMSLFERMEKCAAAMGQSLEDMMNPLNIIAHNMQEMTGMGKYINNINNVSSVVNNRNMQPIVNQNVTINCPNVTNNSGVENIQKELGHLSLKALQAPLKDY